MHVIFDDLTRMGTVIPYRCKLWLENIDLYISEYVIDEVGQGVGSFGSHHSDAADKRAVHRTLYKSEDVLNAASVLGLDTVALLLLVSQRVVAMSLLATGFIPFLLTTSSLDS